jgi:hypothetical protein
MAVNKLFLEPDGLVVGATQLVTSGGGVTIGKNLAVAGSIFTANLSVNGPVSITGNFVISNTASSTSTTTGAFVVAGGVGVAGNLFLGGQLNITRSTNGDAFLVNSPGGSTPNFTVQGSGEQTFRLYNSAATGSTRTSIKLASRNNTDWEWIAYTDAAGTGVNDLTIANQSGTALYLTAGRSVQDFKGDLRAAPINTQSTNYVAIASDAGKTIVQSGSNTTVTFNANVFASGDMISVVNTSAGTITLVQGTSVTLRLAGTATTGTRTLASNGLVTVICTVGGATPTFYCSGAGLT